MALKTPHPFLQLGSFPRSCSFGFKSYGVLQNSVPMSKVYCAMNMAAGQSSNDSGKTKFDQLMEKARKLWEGFPQPVKNFPWNRAFDNFIQLTLDLILAVFKYLSVPLLAVSSLSEMSYCAHERKLKLVPFPLFIGITLAGVLRQTALEISPLLKKTSKQIKNNIATGFRKQVLILPGSILSNEDCVRIPIYHFFLQVHGQGRGTIG
ncbi:hypothetical protein G4B88_001536 [Cannabis sativa]|nr:hypothetical protein G4B88_001536 [Cannabis sativa]